MIIILLKKVKGLMLPKILITNDDGITSPGLKAIVELFPSSAYELTVVAPKHPQSAMGVSHAHGNVWISYEERTDETGIRWITVDGSPATCVSVALRHFHINPDLVISGINFGENLGLNLFYSGTIGAAWEAAMSGHLSLAVSLELPPNKHFTMDEDVDFSAAAFFTKRIAQQLLADHPTSQLWNMNIPSKATVKTEIRYSTTATNRWNYPIIRETKDRADGSQLLRFEFDPTNNTFEPNSDVFLLRKGFVTLTELQYLQFPWVRKETSN